MARIELIYFNAGGGHRAAAQALGQAMQHRPWQVHQTNLVDMLDTKGQFYKLFGWHPEDLYNRRLSTGMTLGMRQELKLLQWMIRLGNPAMIKKMQEYWLSARPDLVVSLIPNFNRALCQSLSQALPGTTFVTVLTDMADHPPNFWIEPDLPQHLVCGTTHAVEQALQAGCPAERIHRSSGMILSPRFYQSSTIDRVQERLKHGLNPRQPVGLVMFGGYGSDVMRTIARSVPDTPLILICGKNAKLAQSLRRMSARAARLVIEFTDDVPYWMRLSDFLIGKPGPASLSEAIQMGLPVIVTRNAWTMPQERWNTQWVRTHGLGVVVPGFNRVREAVAEVVDQLPQLQANVAKIRNRAVFEVPEIIKTLLPVTAVSDHQ